MIDVQGMPGVIRCDRGDYARVLFYSAREAAGALSARHSLCPRISWGQSGRTTRAFSAAGSLTHGEFGDSKAGCCGGPETRERRHCKNPCRHRISRADHQKEFLTMTADPPFRTALIVIDVQRAFDAWEAVGRRRNNLDAVARIAEMLSVFRDKGLPIFHIRHEGTGVGSSFAPDGVGVFVEEGGGGGCCGGGACNDGESALS